MDLHRCRFIPYAPSAINALAFSHSPLPNPDAKAPSTLRLAIGRANGDIEIWNPFRGAWFQEKIIHGGKDRSIEGLAWTQDPDEENKRGDIVPGKLRLFSSGYSSAVTEWDLARGRPARHSSGNFSEIWCIAAQPRENVKVEGGIGNGHTTFATQSIVAGFADGSIVIFSTADNDLQYSKTLARTSKRTARVLSLAFQNLFTAVSGHADSTIRLFDIRNGQQLRSLTLGSGPKGGPRETLVWSLRCLKDGSLVSGDSSGTLCFWDAKTLSISQRIKAHEADILTVAVSADGNSIFSGGMDRRTVLYRRPGAAKGGKRSRWASVAHSRLHKHDLKCMATFESKGLSVLASGGLDTNVMLVPVQEFGNESHRALASLPQQPNLLSVPNHRTILSWWDREVNIWAISTREYQQSVEDGYVQDDDPHGRKLVAKIGEESIIGADITKSGDILAVSTIAGVKVFRLTPSNGVLKAQKVNISFGDDSIKIVKFSPDQKWLGTVGLNDSIQIFRIGPGEDSKERPLFPSQPTKLRRLIREDKMDNINQGKLSDYDRNINNLTFSQDSNIIAATDVAGYLDTWLLEGHEDLNQSDANGSAREDETESSNTSESDEETPKTPIIIGQRWIRNPSSSLFPKLPATPLVVSFRPSQGNHSRALTNGNTAVHPTRNNPTPHSHDLPQGEDRLLIITAGNRVWEFHVLTGGLSDWSRRNPMQTWPPRFRDLRDPAKGVIWDITTTTQRIWLYGVSWLWMFDLAQDMSLFAPHVLNPAVKDTSSNPVALTNGTSDAQSTDLTTKPKSLKRKRLSSPSSPPAHRRPADTGAGSLIPKAEIIAGIGRQMHRIEGDTLEAARVVDLNKRTNNEQLDDDSESESATDTASTSSSSDEDDTDDREDGGVDPKKEGADAKDERQNENRAPRLHTSPSLHPPSPQNWYTFKYRPILGIVPLSTHGSTSRPRLGGKSRGGNSEDDGGDDEDDGEEGERERRLEVVIVERPLWEMDLPPRYFGDREWDA